MFISFALLILVIGKSGEPIFPAISFRVFPGFGTSKIESKAMITVLKFIFRILGYGFLAVAIIAGISDASSSIAQSQVHLAPLGQVLYEFFPDTFPILQPAIERHIHPLLWDPVVLTILIWPVWAFFAPLGLLLLWLGARRQRHQVQFA
ncbi:MAG: hypothetical protein AAGA50_24590 [Pseudomonadota bacterium]